MSEELATSLFDGVWTLLEMPDPIVDDDDHRMVHMARGSCHHWSWGAEAERSAAACTSADDRDAVLADLATIPT